MTLFTVFGANGFVGRELIRQIAARGHSATPVTRANWPDQGRDLGHVIFTIGMTADFREKPFETVEAQVSLLARALQGYRFSSFLALSSTRVYRGATETNEAARLSIAPENPDDLYNATKLAGEALCLALPNPAIRVARLSNLYGTGAASASFLASVLDEARAKRRVVFRTGPASAKDYLDVETAASALIEIALNGRQRLYNVASGTNVSNGEIMAALASAGISCHCEANAPEPIFPAISVRRLKSEFAFEPRSLIDDLPRLLHGGL